MPQMENKVLADNAAGAPFYVLVIHTAQRAQALCREHNARELVHDESDRALQAT